MSMQAWWIFIGTAFFICGTPGPNMLHILTKSAQHGIRRSVASMAGCLTAVIFALIASAIGLGALLMASPHIFNTLRWIGVAYLIYLGICAWMDTGSDKTVNKDIIQKNEVNNHLYCNGLLIGLSNPKLLLFTAAFFPQFIDTRASQFSQYVILILSFACIECFWYSVYGISGQQLMSYLSHSTRKKTFNRIVGMIFISFGLALIKYNPAQ